MRKVSFKKGYALIELLFYISFFALLSITVINSMLVMSSSFKAISENGKLLRSGNMMERMSREIRHAKSISLVTGPSLKLNIVDDSGNTGTVQFSLSGSDLQFLVNDSLVGNLNSSDIAVDSLSFTQISTPQSQGVKIFLSTRAKNSAAGKEANFYDTIILRGSY